MAYGYILWMMYMIDEQMETMYGWMGTLDVWIDR